MNDQYILAIDQGTTSSRAILFDRNGHIAAVNARQHEQLFPHPGWVAHNPKEIYFNVLETTRRVMETAEITPAQIAAIGITNQRETIVAWDQTTGEPVCDAIVWQCRRTADLCRQIAEDGFDTTIRTKTGLLLDPYFSATKIKWLLDNVPAAKIALDKGTLLVGTIDSYLIWNLTGRKVHATDYTNASRTMLFNISELRWDQELLAYFGIPESILPQVVPSSGVVGYTDAEEIGASIPITGVAGDQHAALFGQTCFQVGDVKNTYGTGCFILKNIGDKPIIAQNRLLTTIAWHIDGKATYAVEGSIFNAGSAVKWLINEMHLADNVREINDICAETEDTSGAYFVPAFSGLGAPHWDMYARGTICGMSLSTNREHIVRAVMEAIAYQSRDVIDYMDEQTGLSLSKLRVDGGVSQSDFILQFQSDILNIPVERPLNTETTALGAAYLAGLAVSYYESMEAIKNTREIDAVFRPAQSLETSRQKYNGWLRAVERAKNWANPTQ